MTATPHRRALLRAAVGGTAALGAGTLAAASPAGAAPRPARTPGGAAAEPAPLTPAAAMRRLAAGNRRWRTLRERHPDESRQVRASLESGQAPFAVVLGCIDSRVPPELVYDQGLGDLMTVRSAGEVLDEAVLGSVAYGVLLLDIPLVVVLGHASCGAVTAAVEADASGERPPAHIDYIARRIAPVIDHSLQGQARIDAAIDANVALVRRQLEAEPDLAARIADGRLAVTGARYELHTQAVHPVG